MDADLQTRQSLVLACEGLAASIVRSYYPAGENGPEWTELMQEAWLAIMEAAEEYDPDCAAFQTYAFLWILGRVTRATRPLRRRERGDLDLDQFPAPDPTAFDTARLEALWQAFERLPRLEQSVLLYRFGLRGHRRRTQQKTATKLDVSLSTVKRKERSALDGLEIRLRIYRED